MDAIQKLSELLRLQKSLLKLQKLINLYQSNTTDSAGLVEEDNAEPLRDSKAEETTIISEENVAEFSELLKRIIIRKLYCIFVAETTLKIKSLRVVKNVVHTEIAGTYVARSVERMAGSNETNLKIVA